jgi:hypothetical protein
MALEPVADQWGIKIDQTSPVGLIGAVSEDFQQTSGGISHGVRILWRPNLVKLQGQLNGMAAFCTDEMVSCEEIFQGIRGFPSTESRCGGMTSEKFRNH